MMDLSDGLIVDAGRLCRASGCGAVLQADRLPLAAPLRTLDPRLACDLAARGGEDYELLFAVPPRRTARLRATALGCRVTHVGEIVRGRDVTLVDRDGHPLSRGSRDGHEHFRS